MAYYTVVFQGATGTGALALGAVAQATSIDTGLAVLGGGLVVGAIATLRLSLPAPGDIDVTPADVMPIPDLPDVPVGPVLVTAQYDVAAGNEGAFLARKDRLRHFRQRTGGFEWRMFVDPEVPGRYIETFLVGSWEEHERQHARATQHDSALLEELRAIGARDPSRRPPLPRGDRAEPGVAQRASRGRRHGLDLIGAAPSAARVSAGALPRSFARRAVRPRAERRGSARHFRPTGRRYRRRVAPRRARAPRPRPAGRPGGPRRTRPGRGPRRPVRRARFERRPPAVPSRLEAREGLLDPGPFVCEQLLGAL